MAKENPIKPMLDTALRMRAGLRVKNTIERENHEDEEKQLIAEHDKLAKKLRSLESNLLEWELEINPEYQRTLREMEKLSRDLALLREAVAQFQLNEIQ